MSTFKMLSSTQAELLNASVRERDKIGEQLRFVFDKLIDSAGVTKAVEVGAYEASFSKRFKRRHPEMTSIAYEANPYVYNRFKDRLLQLEVDYRFLCVGPKKGKLTISVPRDFRGTKRTPDNQMASMLSNLQTEESEQIEVDCVRLDDDISLSNDDCIALWIDVEGATSMVLGAAEKALKRTAVILIEVESRPIWEGQWLDEDVNRFLESKGFFPVLRDVQRIHQYNFIYVNPDMVDADSHMNLFNRYLMGTHIFNTD